MPENVKAKKGQRKFSQEEKIFAHSNADERMKNRFERNTVHLRYFCVSGSWATQGPPDLPALTREQTLGMTRQAFPMNRFL
jgi:hypothetical protein